MIQEQLIATETTLLEHSNVRSNMPFHPLDAVITGYSYENATTALGVLEEGSNTKRGISAEMLCTLDNFLRTVFFANHIYVTGLTEVGSDNYAIMREANFEGSAIAKKLFESEKLVSPLGDLNADGAVVNARVKEILKPLALDSEWFILKSADDASGVEIRQELVLQDPYFIEYAIEHAGLQYFKPVFPGDNLYLGCRTKRIKTSGATHTLADAAARRVREIVRARFEDLNEDVKFGAPPLPSLPPLFVSRLLLESPN